MTRSRRVAAGSLIFALALSALTGGAEAARYGLVVGIDAYLPPIPRCTAPSPMPATSPRPSKVGRRRVVLLTDAQASKAAIRAAYDDLLAGAAEGDTLVFAYAGHGSQEPARPGDPEEPDGLDETFPLAGFASTVPAWPSASSTTRSRPGSSRPRRKRCMCLRRRCLPFRHHVPLRLAGRDLSRCPPRHHRPLRAPRLRAARAPRPRGGRAQMTTSPSWPASPTIGLCPR